MDDLLKRAYSAYFRHAEDRGQIMQPSEGCSGIETCRGMDYVVLRNNYEVLAVYRVRNDGQLKRLKRWPKAFEYHD